MRTSIRSIVSEALGRPNTRNVRLVLSPSAESYRTALCALEGLDFSNVTMESQEMDSANAFTKVEPSNPVRPNFDSGNLTGTPIAYVVKGPDHNRTLSVDTQETISRAIKEATKGSGAAVLALLPSTGVGVSDKQAEASQGLTDVSNGTLTSPDVVVKDDSRMKEAVSQLLNGTNITVVDSLEALQAHLCGR